MNMSTAELSNLCKLNFEIYSYKLGLCLQTPRKLFFLYHTDLDYCCNVLSERAVIKDTESFKILLGLFSIIMYTFNT